MNIFEILNTKPEVTWTSNGHRNFGKFNLDSVEYTVQIDEFAINGKTLVDFGFVRNGSHNAVGGNVPAAKVIGAVLNSAVPKIDELNPDFILIAVDKASGLVDSRKSIYDALDRWLQRKTDMLYGSDWVENSKAFYKVFSRKNKPTDEELQIFLSTVKMK